MTKIMTNNEIYANTLALTKAFEENNVTLPIKVNFYLQKNKAALIALAQDIEQSRMEILQKYGAYNNETSQFEFDVEQGAIITEEMNTLFSLEQEVSVYMVNIEDFGENLSLTSKQMEALMFMIN